MQIPPLPQSDGRHDFFTIITLVDITKTNTVRQYNKAMPEDEVTYNNQRNKQRNWETIIQVINLRAQPVFLTNPMTYTNQDIEEYKFGSEYTGKHTLWMFTFGSEHEDIFDLDGIKGGGLINDVHHVPIILGLDETFTPNSAAFDSKTTAKNIILLK